MSEMYDDGLVWKCFQYNIITEKIYISIYGDSLVWKVFTCINISDRIVVPAVNNDGTSGRLQTPANQSHESNEGLRVVWEYLTCSEQRWDLR